MVISGSNLLVYIKGTGAIGDADELYPVGCDRTCTLEIDVDMIETTVKDNGYNKTCLPSFVGYQITGDGLTDFTKQMGTQSLQIKALNRTLIVFKFQAKQDDDNAITYSGQGYLQTVTLSGPVGAGATYSYTLIGTGALEIDNSIPVTGGGSTPADDMAQVYPLYFKTTTDQTSYQNDALVGASVISFEMEGLTIYKDDGDDEWDGFDSDTGTLTWNFEAENLSRCLIVYKK